jgi:ribosomal protein L11 methyltransferase
MSMSMDDGAKKRGSRLRGNDGGGSAWKLTLPCTRAEAERINEDVPELALIDPAPALITREPDETQPSKWELSAYFEEKPDACLIALIQSLVPSAAKLSPLLEQLPNEDWVTVSQAGLEPVHAGRFYVHTQTNRGTPPLGTTCFQIEASQAFGTGGHATTAGCLAVLDGLKRRGARFDHIVDIGTGTGLLAFAARHLWPRAYVTASDIDPVSIDVTVDNAQINTVPLGQHPGHLALCAASGTDHEMIQRRAPYDLVIANILAGPLIELAPAFAEIMADGGTLILAGLLAKQVDTVSAAYRRVGLRVAAKRGDGDWPCLRLVKRTRYGWQRPARLSRRTTQPPGDFGTW